MNERLDPADDERRRDRPGNFADVWRAARNGVAPEDVLSLPIGIDDDGAPEVANLANDAVVLVSGPPRSGKTTAVRTIVAGLLMGARPDQVNIVMVDTSGHGYDDFSDAPHFAHPIVTDPREAVSILSSVDGEIDTRMDLLASQGARNVGRLPEPPPRLVVCIDDLLPLLRTDEEATLSLLVRLAERSRPAGVHTVIATAAPLPALARLLPNITEQIAFDLDLLSGAVPSPSILGDGQLSRGEFLWEPMESTYPVRRHTIPVSPTEARQIVDRWREFV